MRMCNWEVEINFKIHGKGKDLFGDGMVFWYTRDRMVPEPVSGSMDNFYSPAIIMVPQS